ncbi:polyprenyl diphosphate synthase [Streptomyces sp. TRM70308]|uniref:polyprenyl diphosphate synthase n=1 Tax=Streptomyces sp. TRM70308 TaxID=3131932 RepID=UPI003D00DD00
MALVMDGNGRWAAKRGRPRVEGHEAGQVGVFETIDAAIAVGVPFLTVYAFSTENWKRESEEIRRLMGLMEGFAGGRLREFVERGVRVQRRGRTRNLPPTLLKALEHAERVTAHCSTLTYTVCIDHGGQAELVDAARAMARQAREGLLDAEDIDESTLTRFLDTGSLPAVDLFIRPGGEQRLSNFLLWHSAYAELVFPQQLWPDFTRHHFWQAVQTYATRARRFGQAT